LLHESYGVQRVCVCQTIFRSNAPLFNRQVKLLTKYLKVVLEPNLFQQSGFLLLLPGN